MKVVKEKSRSPKENKRDQTKENEPILVEKMKSLFVFHFGRIYRILNSSF